MFALLIFIRLLVIKVVDVYSPASPIPVCCAHCGALPEHAQSLLYAWEVLSTLQTLQWTKQLISANQAVLPWRVGRNQPLICKKLKTWLVLGQVEQYELCSYPALLALCNLSWKAQSLKEKHLCPYFICRRVYGAFTCQSRIHSWELCCFSGDYTSWALHVSMTLTQLSR